MRLAVLMTVYNEARFLESALESIKDHVDDIVIVEGAYQETIKLGQPARSDDGTIEIAKAFIQERNHQKILAWEAIHGRYDPMKVDEEVWVPYRSNPIEANEESDAQQRNVGLTRAKVLEADWLLIVDGDEVYQPHMFKMIRQAMKSDIDAFYFTCKTFVNDFRHYTDQEFPRLFKLYPDTEFVNDNYVRSNGKSWSDLKIGKLDVRYFHYAFMKGIERFEIKKKWWETRFPDKVFHYDWSVKDGQIVPDNHKIYEYDGSHPIQQKKACL